MSSAKLSRALLIVASMAFALGVLGSAAAHASDRAWVAAKKKGKGKGKAAAKAADAAPARQVASVPPKSCTPDGYQTGAATSYANGVTSGVAVADMNDDGLADIVVGNAWDKLPPSGRESAGVMLNNGDGTFAKMKAAPIPTDPTPGHLADVYVVAVGDLNGDGKPDVVSAGGGTSSYLLYWLNKGDGTLAPAVAVDPKPFGAQQGILVVADLNDDKNQDIIFSGGSSVQVFLNAGKAKFAGAVSYDIPDGGYVEGLAVADLNGDARPDIVWVESFNNNTYVLLNDKRGSFGKPVKHSIPAGGLRSGSGVVLADFNGDGKADLAALAVEETSSPFKGSNVTIAPGNGDGTFGTPSTLAAGERGGSWLVAADLNNDGGVDLAMCDYDNGQVRILMNAGDGTFAAPFTVAVAPDVVGIAAGDFFGTRVLGLAVVQPNAGAKAHGDVYVLPGRCD